MGRFCKVCGCSRSNESFGGKGRRRVVCKRCRKKGKKYVDMVLSRQEISGFMDQKNISEKNIKRLKELTKSDNQKVAREASLVLEVAKIKPAKKKRLGFLWHNYPELFMDLYKEHLVWEYVNYRYYDYDWCDEPQVEIGNRNFYEGALYDHEGEIIEVVYESMF